MIRQIIGNMSWVIFLLFSFICLKRKRYHLLGLSLILLFCSIFIPEADILKVSKEGMQFVRRRISKENIEKIEKQEGSPNVYPTQEYPTFPGISYQNSIDLAKSPAIMKWQKGEHRFWLGLGNAGKCNFSNPTLFLNFKGKIQVRVDANDSRGWVETDPNVTYVNNIKADLQPGMGFRLNPLYVTFSEEGVYPVTYTITGDNYPPIEGVFNIIVKKAK